MGLVLKPFLWLFSPTLLNSVLFLFYIELFRTSPVFAKKGDSTYDVNIGDDLIVAAEVIVFGTTHFQLLQHYNETNDTNSTLQFHILKTPRRYTKMEDDSKNNRDSAGKKHKLEYLFHNISEKDFASYSIMAGNSEGYDVYPFSIEKKPSKSLFVSLIFVCFSC